MERDVLVVAGRAVEYRGNLHEELKLVLVRDSAFTVRRRGTTYRAAPWSLIALHADDAHSGGPDGAEAHWLIMCVAPSLVAEVVPPPTLRFADPVLPGDGLAARFRMLCEDPGGPGLEAGVLELIGALARRSSGPAREVQGADGRALDLLREYLRANLERNVTLDELSAVTGLGKYRLVRACTARYGLPPHRVHLRLRLDRARELLRRGRPIGDVALQTGFHDQPHLTRAFRQVYGLTPGGYRSLWGKNVQDGPDFRG